MFSCEVDLTKKVLAIRNYRNKTAIELVKYGQTVGNYQQRMSDICLSTLNHQKIFNYAIKLPQNVPEQESFYHRGNLPNVVS